MLFLSRLLSSHPVERLFSRAAPKIIGASTWVEGRQLSNQPQIPNVKKTYCSSKILEGVISGIFGLLALPLTGMILSVTPSDLGFLGLIISPLSFLATFAFVGRSIYLLTIGQIECFINRKRVGKYDLPYCECGFLQDDGCRGKRN